MGNCREECELSWFFIWNADYFRREEIDNIQHDKYPLNRHREEYGETTALDFRLEFGVDEESYERGMNVNGLSQIESDVGMLFKGFKPLHVWGSVFESYTLREYP